MKYAYNIVSNFPFVSCFKNWNNLAILRQLVDIPTPKQALIYTAKVSDKISAAILTKLILIAANPQLICSVPSRILTSANLPK